jgi:hypothetical protein
MRSRLAFLLPPLLALSCLAAASTLQAEAGLDTALIERLTGAQGALDAASGVF